MLRTICFKASGAAAPSLYYYPLPRRRGPKGGHLGALAYGRSVRHEQGQEQASRREGGCGGGA